MTLHEIVPNWKYVTNITNEQRAVVTCANEHNFFLYELVTLHVSKYYGMNEVDGMTAKIIDLDDITITLNLDTTSFTPFVFPISDADALKTTPPHVVPSASGIIETNLDQFNSQPFGTTLEDSFDNVRTF
jgi:hypothetical protein